MRPNKKDYYLEIAEVVAKRSTCLRAKYGAVIVKDDQIVGTGYNGAPRGEANCCDVGNCKRQEMHIAPGERYELCNAVHAEMNACLAAGRQNCIGATLYLAGWRVDQNKIDKITPCLMCSRVIKNSGIIEVVS